MHVEWIMDCNISNTRVSSAHGTVMEHLSEGSIVSGCCHSRLIVPSYTLFYQLLQAAFPVDFETSSGAAKLPVIRSFGEGLRMMPS